MPALLFGFIDIIIIFLLEVPIFYLLVKAFYKSVKFISTLKALLLYGLFYLIFAFLYPEASGKFFYIISPFIVLIISFGLFFLATKLTKLINWKQWQKGVVLFLLMFIIATPLLDYFTNMLIFMPIARNIGTSGGMEISSLFNPVSLSSLLYRQPLGWTIIGKLGLTIGNGLLSNSVIKFILVLQGF